MKLYVYGSFLEKTLLASDLDLVVLSDEGEKLDSLFLSLEQLSRALCKDIDLKLNPPGEDFASCFYLSAEKRQWHANSVFTGKWFFSDAVETTVEDLASMAGVALDKPLSPYPIIDEDAGPITLED